MLKLGFSEAIERMLIVPDWAEILLPAYNSEMEAKLPQSSAVLRSLGPSVLVRCTERLWSRRVL